MVLGKLPWAGVRYYQKYDRNGGYLVDSGRETIIDLSSLRRDTRRIGMSGG